MERVGRTPELLQIILSFAERPSAAVASKACRLWHDVATRYVWNSLDDLLPVFVALGAVDDKSEAGLHFTIPPTARNWNNASYLFNFVRTLNYNAEDCKPIGDSAWTSLIITCIPGAIFPSLRSVTWTAVTELDMHRCIAFLNPNVTYFRVGLSSEPEDFSPFLSTMASLLPNLLHLHVVTNLSVLNTAKDLAEFIRSFPHLREVILPTYHASSDILNALQELTHLEIIDTYGIPTSLTEEDRVQSLRRAPINYRFPHMAFANLRCISIELPMSTFTLFLETAFSGSPSVLTHVGIVTHNIEDDQVVKSYLKTVVRYCPMMTETWTFMSNQPPSSYIHMRTPVISFDSVSPLLDMNKLTFFMFGGEIFLDMNEDEFYRLLVACPNLEGICTSTNMVTATIPPPASRLTLNCLVLLAKYCPKIKDVTLYLNALWVPDIELDFRWTTLRELRHLGVVDSPIQNARAVALFLTWFIPSRKTKLAFRTNTYQGSRTGVWPPVLIRDVRVLDYLDDNAARWKMVSKEYLPLFIDARDRWELSNFSSL